jgi:lipopolysaccharide export system permease protein
VEERDRARGDRVLRLEGGRRYDFSPDGARLDVTDYAQYELRAPLDAFALDAGRKDRPTDELWASPDPGDQAELQWRLAMPVSAVLLLMLALPIGRGEPRSGKYGRLLLALLLYVAYRQALGTAKGLIAVGELAPLPGLWSVHALLALVAIGLAFWRHHAPG